MDSANRWIWYRDLNDTKEATRLYLKHLLEGMKSGDFLYVAHPDLFMMWYGTWDDFAKDIAHQIVQAAKDLNMILEVNMGPSRWGKKNYIGQELRVPYPDEDFWNVVAEADIPCVIGVDNHRPYELKTSPYDWVRSFVSRHQLRWLETIDIPSRMAK